MEKGGRVRLDAPRRIGAESAEVDPEGTVTALESGRLDRHFLYRITLFLIECSESIANCVSRRRE
jgi:hypothetical protein